MKENNFREIFNYWNGKLNLPKVNLFRDNRLKYPGCTHACPKHNFYQLIYNFKKLGRAKNSRIYNIIFHELGHIKHQILRMKLTACEREYFAEKFSLDHLKKYFPKYYRMEIKSWKKILKDKKWCEKYPLHAKAFTEAIKNV